MIQEWKERGSAGLGILVWLRDSRILKNCMTRLLWGVSVLRELCRLGTNIITLPCQFFSCRHEEQELCVLGRALIIVLLLSGHTWSGLWRVENPPPPHPRTHQLPAQCPPTSVSSCPALLALYSYCDENSLPWEIFDRCICWPRWLMVIQDILVFYQLQVSWP